MWRWVAVAGVLVVATGLLLVTDALALLERVAPMLLFLAAITVVAEVADGVGLFEVAARRAAEAARGRTLVLYLLIAVVAVAITVLVSLDTTAVLLTPLVLVLTRRLGLPALPFAVLVVWLANTASLLLPVSNLTNLLAVGAMRELGRSYVVVMAPPALAVVLATVALLVCCYHRRLRGRFQLHEHVHVGDRLLLGVTATVCVGIGGVVAFGVEPAVAAVAGALLLVGTTAVRARYLLSARLLPWRLVLLTTGLFLVVQTVADRGLSLLLADLAGGGTGPGDLLRWRRRARWPPTRSTTCPPTWPWNPRQRARRCGCPPAGRHERGSAGDAVGVAGDPALVGPLPGGGRPGAGRAGDGARAARSPGRGRGGRRLPAAHQRPGDGRLTCERGAARRSVSRTTCSKDACRRAFGRVSLRPVRTGATLPDVTRRSHMTDTADAHAQPDARPDAQDYRLEHRYTRDSGRVLMSSIQALARLPVEQLRRDRTIGLRTAALLSGYPGSPLGGYDLEVSRMRRLHGPGSASDLPLVHQPAVNEELGASAIMGSQLASSRPDARYDGVLGIWYGKAPGLDRATDAIRHGVFAGTSPHGGVVALVGDDPAAKSSTMPSSSDAALVDLHMPILYPGTPVECLELGLHAVAISRACGLWAAMKVVTPVADAVGTVDLPALTSDPVMPEGWDAVERHPSAVFLGSARMIAVEKEFRTVRQDLAYRYGVLNGLNRIPVDPSDAWIGIVSTGYTYYETREALRRLGLATDADLAAVGVRLLQLRMPVPFDRDMVRRFARGLSEIVVVEEKNPTLEGLIKEVLYDTDHRPRVVGKCDETGAELLHSYGLMDADAIVEALRARLSQRLAERLTPEPRERIEVGSLLPLSTQRTPFFCSGCPHNWGTKVAEGTLVGAGTGCHGMSLLMDPALVGDTFGITAMGNEGAPWIGMSPFVETGHVVQNVGDGTYFHSGQLAVQAAIGAGSRITFKILYNDTVAMTGGQEATFRAGVPQLATTLLSLGAKRVVVTVPDVRAYDRTGLPREVDVLDRDDIVAVQVELAAVDGVTVLIHHQPCAAELRRGRKRGTVATPPKRIAINPRICEGCGDCGAVSNCLSVQPVQTPLGRRTRIDQDSCNLDLSCVKGDCPAFMEIDTSADPTRFDATARSGAAADATARSATAGPAWELPQPVAPAGGDVVRIRLAGIGGTGVVTTAQMLGTAAMLDGWHVQGLDQTGLSQKAGPVISDVVLTRGGAESTNLIGDGQASTLLALDGLVGASDPVLQACDPATTRVVLSTTRTPTGRMVSQPAMPYPTDDEVSARLRAVSSDLLAGDATRISRVLLGDAAYANVLLLGAAVQTGAVPVDVAMLRRAVELNGVAVETNLRALAWGRAWAAEPARVEAEVACRRVSSGEMLSTPPLPSTLAAAVGVLALRPATDEVVRMLVADLVGYQDVRYARRLLDVVARVSAVERTLTDVPGAREEELTTTVARHLHKVMAYKDEYEVARLMLLPEADAAAAEAGRGRRSFLLHPPVFAALGRRSKVRFGDRSRPAFAVLAGGRRLRGTRLDPFGATAMRRTERELVGEYVALVARMLAGLHAENHRQAVSIAAMVDTVRGYEALKQRRVAEYRAAVADAVQAYGD